MTYLVFARKWRPQQFSEVVAQPHVTETLSGALASGKAGHAYLFSGPRGVGKTTTARILAKALNCEHGPTPTPCGTCEQCVAVTEGHHLDVIEIDGASNRSIDDVRSLRETVMYSPAMGRAKVYIIDEVHMLTTEAFNALLKTLEEPPGHVTFILATTDPHRLPETILSRCQRFDFRRIPTADIVESVTRIAKEEGLTLEPEAASLVAEKADGSLRDALSILDQVRAYSGETLTVEAATQVLGLVDVRFLLDMTGAIRDADAGRALDLLASFLDGGGDLGEFVSSLARFTRTLTAIKLGSKRAGEAFPSDQRDAMGDLVSNVPIGDLVRMARMSADLGTMLRKRERAFEPRVLVEMLLVRLATLDSTVNLSEVISSVSSGGQSGPSEDLFSNVPSVGKKTEPPPKQATSAAAQEPEEETTTTDVEANVPSELTLSAVVQRWEHLCDEIEKTVPHRFAGLRNGRPVSLDGEVLTIRLPNGGQLLRDEMTRLESARTFSSASTRVFGRPLSVVCEVESAQAEPPREEDPAVQLVIDTLDARVVGRRKTGESRTGATP
jgi:DNA polymerase-3 subunit gamma/tau